MTISNGFLLPNLDEDGKQVVVPYPAMKGWDIYFTGAGDDLNASPPSSGRGEGEKLILSFLTSGTKNIQIQFKEPIQLHDGEMFYSPVNDWSINDNFSFSAIMPKTDVAPNSSNSGNCNLVPQNEGYNVIIPASNNDGAYDIDLTTAIPVPSNNEDGYWDVNFETGEVFSSTLQGFAKFHLLDVQIQAYFLKNIPMGNPMGIFNIDTYKAKWISQKWKLELKVNKQSPNAGNLGAWLMLFRKNTT